MSGRLSRRNTVLVLAAIAAVALAVPALGQSERQVAPKLDRKSLSRVLAKRARVALRTARSAKRRARRARESAFLARVQAGTAQGEAAAAKSQAAAAQGAAAAAKSQAGDTQAQLAATQIVSAVEPGLVSSSASIGDYEAKGGPSVEVTVPSSGLIEVWAQVDIEDEEGGAVGLYEDGQKVAGISDSEICGDDSTLIEAGGLGGPGEFTTFATPPAPGFFGCASVGAPSSVLLSRPPGSHTYELRYSESECSCGGEAKFRNRVLRVGPRL